ncbi:MAG: ABC transporter substrate-binding protein [Actinomycetota bacterium]
MGTRIVVVVVVAALAIAACSRDASPPSVTDDRTITVASFDFPESELIADLYVGALRGAGFEVTHERRIGSREVVLPALQLGLVEVVPEYSGSVVEFLGGHSSADAATVDRTLAQLVAPRGIDALAPSRAQSRNGLVVTSKTAAELSLRSISDLHDVADTLTLGGPVECPDRDLCLRGFRGTYGLMFDSFLPLDAGGPITAEAVQRGTVDVGVLFTSDGSLAEHDLVLLRDDRELQPVEQVTPLVGREAVERFGREMVEALDSVSAELTTSDLRTLNATVADGLDPEAAAAGWLDQHGLAEPVG